MSAQNTVGLCRATLTSGRPAGSRGPLCTRLTVRTPPGAEQAQASARCAVRSGRCLSTFLSSREGQTGPEHLPGDLSFFFFLFPQVNLGLWDRGGELEGGWECLTFGFPVHKHDASAADICPVL